MKRHFAITAMTLSLIGLLPAPSSAQVKVTFGRKKPITMKDLDQARDMHPLFVDKELLAKVHTIAILTVTGSPKVNVGFKTADTTPLVARAETKLVALLTAAGFAVQPLDKTRELVAKEWLSTSIDAMPDEDREKLQNLSPEEKEAYLKENAQRLCENRFTRALFGCPGDEQGGDAAKGGGGNKLQQASPNTLFLRSMAASAMGLDDGAGQQLGAVPLRVAGELAEKLHADAVLVLTTSALLENNKAATNRGKVTANQGKDYAVQTVRIQVVNPDGQFVFAECLREVNREALSKKTFALNYDADMVVERLTEPLDSGVAKEVGHFAGK